MTNALTGKHALVCGASGGIGRATALALATLGADVTVLARSREKLEGLVEPLHDAGSPAARFLMADLDERAALGEVITSQNKMIDRLGTTDASAEEEAMKEAYRNDIVRTRLLCKGRPNFELMEVNYKATIEDATGTASKVNAFLGGQLNEADMRAAVDGSLYRNRASS